jgi:hypothetical protein
MQENNPDGFHTYYIIPRNEMVRHFMKEMNSFYKESTCMQEIVSLSRVSDKVKDAFLQYLETETLENVYFFQFMQN